MKKKKIPKKIVKILSIIPYSQMFVLVIDGEFEDAYELINKQKSENAKETIKHIEENKSKYFNLANRNVSAIYTKLPHGYVMVIRRTNTWVGTVGNIVHEATHLSHYVLRNVGIELSEETQEAYTYLVESLVERICEIAWPR